MNIKKTTIHKWEGQYGGHKFVCQGEIDEFEAKKIQASLGYHPNGYGFYMHRISKGVTTWECSTTCD